MILIHKPTTGNLPSIVYDFDTTLDPFGLPFETYFSKTLLLEPDPEVDQGAMLSFIGKYPRFFKLISAEEYLRLFASTRKHMVKVPSIHKTGLGNEGLGMEAERWEGGWLAKPPSYPPIRTEGE